MEKWKEAKPLIRSSCPPFYRGVGPPPRKHGALVHDVKNDGPREWLADYWPVLLWRAAPSTASYVESSNDRATLCRRVSAACLFLALETWPLCRPWRSSLPPSSFFFLHMSCLFMRSTTSFGRALYPHLTRGFPLSRNR
jgi:hypothetical protein